LLKYPLDFYYTQLQEHGAAPLVSEWKEKTDVLGKDLHLATAGRIIVGKVMDMNQDGLLIVLDNAGQEHHVAVGDYPAM
jgi:biotin-(acetyl-CoA carboxylase) ligase